MVLYSGWYVYFTSVVRKSLPLAFAEGFSADTIVTHIPSLENGWGFSLVGTRLYQRHPPLFEKRGNGIKEAPKIMHFTSRNDRYLENEPNSYHEGFLISHEFQSREREPRSLTCIVGLEAFVCWLFSLPSCLYLCLILGLPIVTMSMCAIFILRIHCTSVVNLKPTHLLVKFAEFCVDGFMMLARHCILGRPRPSCGIEKNHFHHVT